jgi:hypothetical protein
MRESELNTVRCKTWETLDIGFKKGMLKLGKRETNIEKEI